MGENRLVEAMAEEAAREEQRQVQRRKRNGRFASGFAVPVVEEVDTIEPVTPVEPVHRAVKMVLAAGGEPFCDVAGVALIRRPACDGRQRNRLTFRLKSDATTGWIARLLFDAELPPLTRQELTSTLQILEGLAIDNETPVMCEDVVEQDIVLQTLAAMLRSELIPFHMTATMLLHKLQDYGIFSPNDPRWPADGARLTAHLWKSRQWLYELHIGYRYERLKGQRLHHFCPIWDVSKACLDMWRPPQVAPIPANERRPYEENWREVDWSAVDPAASPVPVSPMVASPVVALVPTIEPVSTRESPRVDEPQRALAGTPAALTSPSAPSAAPSASDTPACSYGRGNADDADDAGFQCRPSEGPSGAAGGGVAGTVAESGTPEPPPSRGSGSHGSGRATPEVGDTLPESSPETRYIKGCKTSDCEPPAPTRDITKWIEVAMAISRETCKNPYEPDEDLDEATERDKPSKRKRRTRLPDRNSSMPQWEQDAEAYLNDGPDL